MFPYYGGKRRLASRYPAPVFGTIIEPFAGGAAYASYHAMRNPGLRVVLVEKDAEVAELWRWLLSVSVERVWQLPALATGDRIDAQPGLSDPERLMLRMWADDFGRAAHLVASRVNGHDLWQRRGRRAVLDFISTVNRSRWQIIEGDYTDAPDLRATWFVDPPYAHGEGAVGGARYRHNNIAIDYALLGKWCRTRRGQVIVCEYGDASWLPFRPFARQISSQKSTQTEVIYTQGASGVPVLRR